MTDQHRTSPPYAFAARARQIGARLLVIAFASATIAAAGCKTVDYRAAKLPDELQVPPATHTADLDLARMAGPGQGTSEIAPGDLVELMISSGRGEEVVEPVQVRVSRAGQLAVPLIGLVPVAGLEPFEAEQRITAAAIERNIYRQPSVTLQVTEQSVNRITVLGAVKNPGVHSLPRGSSDLANAIAAAGGLTEVAGTQVDVLRHDSPSFFAEDGTQLDQQAGDGVQLASYEEGDSTNWKPPGDATAARTTPPNKGPARTERLDLAQAEPTGGNNHHLNDRDVVMILADDKRLIHVSGLVHKADQFEMPRNQDVRVLDAIAMAGGTTTPLADKVFVVRRLKNMDLPTVIQVSIAKAKRDGSENLRLAPGDLVSVESTPTTIFVDTIRDFFHVGLGLGSSVVFLEHRPDLFW